MSSRRAKEVDSFAMLAGRFSQKFKEPKRQCRVGWGWGYILTVGL